MARAFAPECDVPAGLVLARHRTGKFAAVLDDVRAIAVRRVAPDDFRLVAVLADGADAVDFSYAKLRWRPPDDA